MGGGSYDRDVGTSSSSSGFSGGGTSSSGAKSAMGRRSMHKDTSPYDRTIKSETESPIVVNLDVTGSNIEFARIVYDKAPMFYGQIEQQGYLKDFDICFSATGDATCDSSPLQVCDFKKGIELDKELKKIYLESGGGGQLTETYELSAYYLANKCEMPNAKTPFAFFIVDEAPYSSLDRDIVKEIIGDSLSEDISSKKVFQNLFNKFNGNVFIFENNYQGSGNINSSQTKSINKKWLETVGKQYESHIIPVVEEKSIVDLMLGTIALASGNRNMDAYLVDMGKRGQTNDRKKSVQSSLGNLSKALVPRVDANLPDATGKKKRSSGAGRL